MLGLAWHIKHGPHGLYGPHGLCGLHGLRGLRSDAGAARSSERVRNGRAARSSKRAAGAILEDKATTDKGTVGIVSLKRIDLITAVIVDLKLTVKVRENTCREL